MKTTSGNLQEFAADCAEHILELFEEFWPNDHRPQAAITAARAHARGEIDAGSAEEAAGSSHLAGSAVDIASAAYAAYAAARAALSGQGPGYIADTCCYAIAAARAAQEERPGSSDEEAGWAEQEERAWQEERFEERFQQSLAACFGELPI